MAAVVKGFNCNLRYIAFADRGFLEMDSAARILKTSPTFMARSYHDPPSVCLIISASRAPRANRLWQNGHDCHLAAAEKSA